MRRTIIEVYNDEMRKRTIVSMYMRNKWPLYHIEIDFCDDKTKALEKAMEEMYFEMMHKQEDVEKECMNKIVSKIVEGLLK